MGGRGGGGEIENRGKMGRYREKRRMISFSSSPCLSDSAHRVTTIITTAAAGAGGVSLLASELAVVVIVVANSPATHLSYVHTYTHIPYCY